MKQLSSIRRYSIYLLLAALALSGFGIASACNVPVFRYALEHWRADRYRLMLVHRGPLNEEAQALAAGLEEQQELPSSPFEFRELDVTELEEPDQDRFAASLGDLALPALIVQYPERVGIAAPFWKVPFNREQFDALAHSPARRELVRRLAQGQTAVWLLLESGDQAQDDAAEALLVAELQRLEKELKLPELTKAPEDNLSTGLPLAIAFSVLRVARGKEEAALTAMLLGSESDLQEQKVPLVFPVFGRGRALLPMVGKGINAGNTKDYAEFLVSACSCEVKEQNPGFDLLLTADWAEELGRADGPRAGSSSEPGPPELVPIPPGTAEKVATTDARLLHPTAEVGASPRRRDWLIAGVLVALVGAGWLSRMRRL